MKVITNDNNEKYLELKNNVTIRLLTPPEFAKETTGEFSSYKEFYFPADIDGVCYYIHKRQIEDNDLKFKKFETYDKNHKKVQKGTYLNKKYSFIDGYNKEVEKTGIGNKIEKHSNQ